MALTRRILTIALVLILSLCAFVDVDAATKLSKPKLYSKKTTTSSATIKWKKVKKASKYQIQQKIKGKWKKSKKTKKRTFTVKNLKAGTTYKFRIRALKGKKKSLWRTFQIKTKANRKTTDPTDESTTEDGGTPEFNRPTDRYTYEASVVNPENYKYYTTSKLRGELSVSGNDGVLPIYIKTNDDYDTDYTDFELVLYKSSNVPSIGTIKTVSELDKENLGESREYGCQFDDVEYIADDTATVNGGYLLGITTPKTGAYRVAVAVKDTKNYNKYKIVAFTNPISVNSFDTLLNEDADNIKKEIEKAYPNIHEMGYVEKAKKIAFYVRHHSYYSYRANYGGYNLLKKSIVPEFYNKQFGCATMAPYLQIILEKFDITDSMHNVTNNATHLNLVLSDGTVIDGTPGPYIEVTENDLAKVL